MTQSQLSEKLGVNRATLASYEEGRAEPKFESFQKMAGFFKVSLDDLLLKKLEDEGVKCRIGEIAPEAIVIESMKKGLDYLKSFKEGLFQIQDERNVRQTFKSNCVHRTNTGYLSLDYRNCVISL